MARLILALIATSVPLVSHAVEIETVPVGNTANQADNRYETLYGAVAYQYSIGKYEVTAGQYCQFLNAVAKDDAHGLYSTEMMSQKGCKIERAGSPGDYEYSVVPERTNRPVNYVSWADAVRFVNWLHNGQLTGAQDSTTTEDGVYKLGYGGYPMQDWALMQVARREDWTWALPTEDEWHKAAYHKNDGNTGNYYSFPTSSNNTPSDDLVDPDPGNNVTIYGTIYGSDHTLPSYYYQSEVGAHENSEGPYGTFDQGGNVWELTESVKLPDIHAMRGGSWLSDVNHLQAYYTLPGQTPSYEGPSIGFRVVQLPEPSALVLLAAGGLALLRRH